ncbi:MAG TPA: HEAT repeat domain-containing protein [Phycisphaerae bacterium]|nr:HEAT repeat domain-containing protein [Phycisphaerae bacterium]
MKRKLSIHATITILLVTAGVFVPAFAAADADLRKHFLAKIDELLPGMGAENLVDREKPQQALERMCFENSGPGKETWRAALCAAMMERVGPDVAKPARVWLLRKVESIGRGEVVPRLTELLHDPDPQIREEARQALQNNPVSKAGAALRDELKIAGDDAWRVALINALAFRRDRDAVSQISKLASDQNQDVAASAIAALGSIADDKSIATLAVLRKEAAAEMQDAVADAGIRAAETLVTKGDKRKAAGIYEELFAPSRPESVRIAALRGIAAAKGADAMPELLKLMAGRDDRLRMVAGQCAESIPGKQVTTRLIDALADASSDAQVVLLDVLGRRGDKAALPAVMKSVESTSPEVRVAAVGALRHIGNGSNVEMLAALAAQSTDAERDAARETLARMRGQDVDDAILKLIPSVADRVKAELVRAAAARFMKPAFDILLQNTNDADESVRVLVIDSIGRLARPKDLPGVLKAFAKLDGDRACKAARNALVEICRYLPDADQQSKPLIDAMGSAEPSAQVLILQAVAELRGEGALDTIRKSVQSDNPQVKQAAAKALSDWGPFYCAQWVFAGPYKKEGAKSKDIFDVAFAPEDANATVEWKPLARGQKAREDQIDLDRIGNEQDCCAYLRTQVWSETDQEVTLTFGSDDGIKAWLNGAVVHANNTTRGCQPNEDQVPAKLKKGWNVLMVKVTQGDGNWAFSCGIKAAEGGPPAGIKCEAR